MVGEVVRPEIGVQIFEADAEVPGQALIDAETRRQPPTVPRALDEVVVFGPSGPRLAWQGAGAQAAAGRRDW